MERTGLPNDLELVRRAEGDIELGMKKAIAILPVRRRLAHDDHSFGSFVTSDYRRRGVVGQKLVSMMAWDEKTDIEPPKLNDRGMQRSFSRRFANAGAAARNETHFVRKSH